MMWSISVMMSWLRVISAAARLAGSWSAELAPMSVDATNGCCLLQAMDRVTGFMFSLSAIFMMASVVVMVRSLMKRSVIFRCLSGPLR